MTTGLTTHQAQEVLQRTGFNEVADNPDSLIRRALKKLWAPVPWMLEATILFELWLGKYPEAAIITALILFNVAVAIAQEGRARTALAALKSQLALNAFVRRDGVWVTIPSREIVPGDLVKLSLGGVAPADLRLTAGEVLLDQSMLTGESVPVETGAGAIIYAGALVRRGEAEALVTATGVNTKFGRTAELIKMAHATSSQQKTVLHVVRNLAIFNGLIIVALSVYAWQLGLPLTAIEPIILTAILASIPVSLPATFTMAAALSAHVLARRGVLATRLSALDEAGTIDVLCSDKTGTLTSNELRVVLTRPFPGFDEIQLLDLAALASSDSGADPVDAAIHAFARAAGPADQFPGHISFQRISFQAFDPATKRAEAYITDEDGHTKRVMKGAFAVIANAAGINETQRCEAEHLEEQGHRVLAVAVETQGDIRIAGLIALSDPPREDAAALVHQLEENGVRVLMVTGDAPATAESVALKVGITGPVCLPDVPGSQRQPDECAVFAGVLPEDKFRLVHDLQSAGHTVGMCGDGANDAPALRQAHMGIAVSQATDVARAAAGLVLTEPGLGGIMAAIEEGRKSFRRVQTYTLNSIIKKIVTVLFIALGFVMTGHAILTTLLMIVLLVTGDFLSMAITTDRATPSSVPNVWRIGALTIAGTILGLAQLIFSIAILAVGHFWLRLTPDTLITLAFLTLVFTGQAMIYAVRTRRTLRETPPGAWLIAASVADVIIGIMVAMSGWITAPLSATVVFLLFVASFVFTFVLNGLRRIVFARINLT
ncbi:HAD-IC family P-type ATPase [Nitrosomonas sp.]|uniref:HAD-IC family P-type ATPase n=1 Tax=Nitrosomonas sp. TaxID=42353 RepID=UPI0025DBC12C|nr:HAD-IC family P-type ATPase [Nitrosomonas sp.]MCC6915909.1 HAD-IC family P-type ATPase [Nitrosomonas sp.]